MTQDKRPKQTIDMTPNPTGQTKPLLELPSPNAGEQNPSAGQTASPEARRGGSRFFGYLMAGILGGLGVAAIMYLALTQGFLGLSLTAPDTRRQIDELRARTADLDKALRVQPRAPSSNVNSTAQGSPGGLNEVEARLDNVLNAARAIEDSVQALSQRLQTVEQKNGNGRVKEAVQAELTAQLAPISQRLSSAERELEALARAQNERQADARAAALTLALTNLKRTVGDGRPFSAELAAVENLSTVKLPVSELTPYKDTGVHSLAELQNDFAGASRKAIQSHYRSNSNSLMGEVISRAKAAIQVRPSDSAGDTVEAILGRMETALKAGNLQAALTEGAALQGPAQQDMQAWLEKARARVAAEEALAKTDRELLASLTKVPGKHP
jgi:hypothetical protein